LTFDLELRTMYSTWFMLITAAAAAATATATTDNLYSPYNGSKKTE